MGAADRIAMPPGGVLHLKNSYGEVAIEGWDRPEVEVATFEASNKIRIATGQHGNEVLVTTTLPKVRVFPPPDPFRPATTADLDYRIHVPRGARIVVEHQVGEVHLEGVAGEVDVHVLRGQVTLRLPQDGRYAIDAKTDFGAIDSDFPGTPHRRLWLMGREFIGGDARGARVLHLRVGIGDITILKIRTPEPPAPLQ